MNQIVEPSRLSFHCAQQRDVALIHALVESAYRGEASKQGWTTEAGILDGQRVDAAEVTELIARPDSMILLCQSSGELLACVHVEREETTCYLGMFSVRPTLQGGGIGRVVLAEAEGVARVRWQSREMRMTVISVRDELIAWYERRGYRRSGEYKPFPYGDERFGIPKREDLRFEWLVKSL